MNQLALLDTSQYKTGEVIEFDFKKEQAEIDKLFRAYTFRDKILEEFAKARVLEPEESTDIEKEETKRGRPKNDRDQVKLLNLVEFQTKTKSKDWKTLFREMKAEDERILSLKRTANQESKYHKKSDSPLSTSTAIEDSEEPISDPYKKIYNSDFVRKQRFNRKEAAKAFHLQCKQRGNTIRTQYMKLCLEERSVFKENWIANFIRSYE